MEFWKSVDDKSEAKDVKVIISDNLLQYNGVRISDFTIEETADMYDLYNVEFSKKLCIVDDKGNNKLFCVCIDDNVFIPSKMEKLYFITGGSVPYFNNNNSVIEGIMPDPEDEENGFITFIMHLKDPVFIDIDNASSIVVIKINTNKSYTSDIVSSI